MLFINRKPECLYVEEARRLSKKKAFYVVIYGQRRIGKTRLILETLKKCDIYFFVNKGKSSESLLREFEQILRDKKMLQELESLRNWDDFFKIIFSRYKGTIAFDEFQNFLYVDKSVFGILQKHIDINENKKDILVIFSGSTIGLIKKIFMDSKEPLYGRIKRQLCIKQMSFADTAEMCKEVGINNIEEIIKLYSIFGGFPKYYVAIEDENLHGKGADDIIKRFFMDENAILENEAIGILSIEFGKRTGVYFDILNAIANGSTRISEIASFLGRKETAITRQINELKKYFEFIDVENQAIGKKNIMVINHPLMNFWFRFFFRNISSYKRREDWLIKKILDEFNIYLGRRFEKICRIIIQENNGMLPFNFDKIGSQWGRIPQKAEGDNQYEIDIVALNSKTKDIMFAECKWQNNADAEKILADLKKKTQYVQWFNGERKEHFAIFARSFRKKSKDCLCFDLHDIDKIVKRHQL